MLYLDPNRRGRGHINLHQNPDHTPALAPNYNPDLLSSFILILMSGGIPDSKAYFPLNRTQSLPIYCGAAGLHQLEPNHFKFIFH
jgi:hypothetical protein